MHKPGSEEEEYFARENAEKIRKLAAEQRAHIAESEKAKLRQLHHKRCPSCGMELHDVTYRNVKIERCFACNGTFLAAGEFEKLAKAEPKGVMNDVLRLFEHKHTP